MSASALSKSRFSSVRDTPLFGATKSLPAQPSAFCALPAGDHWHFKHPAKPGNVTVAHPVRDIPIGTLKSIERQSGLKLRK